MQHFKVLVDPLSLDEIRVGVVYPTVTALGRAPAGNSRCDVPPGDAPLSREKMHCMEFGLTIRGGWQEGGENVESKSSSFDGVPDDGIYAYVPPKFDVFG